MAKSITIALELDTKDFDKGIKDARGEIRGLGKDLESGSSKGGAFRGAMLGVTAAIAGVATAAIGLKGSLEAASAVENLGVTLETLYGSSEKAAQSLQIIKDEAAKLPVALNAIQEGIPSLALVEEKFGGLGNSIQFTSGIANAFGMSFQEASTNVQRALSAGIGAADLFRDKGVKAFLGFEEGVEYTAEQTQLLFLQAFEKVTAGNEKAAQTLTGQYSMVQDAIFQVQEAFGTAFGDTVREVLTKFNAYFSENKEVILETARAFGENLGNALTFVIENFNKLIPIIAGVAAGFATMKVLSVGAAFVTFAKNVNVSTFSIKALNKAIMANPIGLIAGLVAMAVAAFVDLAISAGGVTNAFKIMGNGAVEAVNTIYQYFSGASEFIKEIFSGLGEYIADAINPFEDADFSATMGDAWQNAKDKFQETIDASGPFTLPFDVTELETAKEEYTAALEGIEEQQQITADNNAVRSQAEIEQTAQMTAMIEQLQERIQKLEEEKAAVHEKEKERKDKEKEDTLTLAELEQQRFDENYAKQIRKIETMIEENERQNELIGLTQLEREKVDALSKSNEIRDALLADIYARNIDEDEKAKLVAQTNAEIDGQNERLVRAIELTNEQQTKFSTGWADAFAKYKDDAVDNAQFAHDMFNKFTSGMEDALVNFVMTGKSGFKDLIDSMIKEIVRFMAKQAVKKFLDLLTGGFGGKILSILGFDKGGYIPAGGVGIVGERGPELVQGPAFVTGRVQTAQLMRDMQVDRGGMGGGGPVTFNINAVDARSFKQLVAQDPEFIYNVSMKGSRRLPV